MNTILLHFNFFSMHCLGLFERYDSIEDIKINYSNDHYQIYILRNSVRYLNFLPSNNILRERLLLTCSDCMASICWVCRCVIRSKLVRCDTAVSSRSRWYDPTFSVSCCCKSVLVLFNLSIVS